MFIIRSCALLRSVQFENSKFFSAFLVLLENIARYCGCIPTYMDHLDILTKHGKNKPCDFFHHAVCVAEVINVFSINGADCAPACTEHSFRAQSIQVSAMKQ